VRREARTGNAGAGFFVDQRRRADAFDTSMRDERLR